MAEARYDLLIRAGRIVCPTGGLDSPGAVGICGGRIASVGADVTGEARQVLEFPNALLLPGLIDLHAHPARTGSVFGVEPDPNFLDRGTTTVASQGDAGADDMEAYLRETVEKSRTHILSAINLSSVGESAPEGCFERVEDIDVAKCVSAVERFREHVWAVSVNASHQCCGRTDPREVLRLGLSAAEQTSLPILYGMRRPEDWPLADQLKLLRAGDVVTYCFRRTPHCIVENDRVSAAVRGARQRGILFDVGHGRASFDFEVAEAALGDGFGPDTISTDLQKGHIGQTPIHDLPLVMSKLHAAGMPETELFSAVTSKPAEILRRNDEIGTLKTGSRADLVLLERHEAPQVLVDAHGSQRTGSRWRAVLTIRNGRRCRGNRSG